jgi:hypothetical protein
MLKRSGAIYWMGSIALIVSPWIVVFFTMNWVSSNHDGIWPGMEFMPWYEILIMAIASLWALCSVYCLMVESDYQTKLESKLRDILQAGQSI